MYVCAPPVCSTYRDLKGALHPLEHKLQMIVNLHVNAGSKTMASRRVASALLSYVELSFQSLNIVCSCYF